MASVSYKEFYAFKRDVLDRLSALETALYQGERAVIIPDIAGVLSSIEGGEDEWAGISPKVKNVLISAGFDSPAKVLAAKDDDILAVKGVGEKALADIRGNLK